MTGPEVETETAPPPDAGIFGLDVPEKDAAVVLIPVPFDATASYGTGSCDGPAAIRRASHQVDLFDPELGSPHEAGIVMLAECDEIVRYNTEARTEVRRARQAQAAHASHGTHAARVDALATHVNDWVYEQVRQWLDRGRVVGTVGGDHSTAFGAIRAHVAEDPGLGILHIDAHADLRRGYEGFTWSHASVMHNVLERTSVRKLVQVGVRDLCEAEAERIRAAPGRISTYYDSALAAKNLSGEPVATTFARVADELPETVYVSFDVDGLDPSLCPSTGTPVPGGLTFREACLLLSTITRSGRRIVGFDLTEVAPGPEGNEWDGNVAARILYKLCGHCLRQGRSEEHPQP